MWARSDTAVKIFFDKPQRSNYADVSIRRIQLLTQKKKRGATVEKTSRYFKLAREHKPDALFRIFEFYF